MSKKEPVTIVLSEETEEEIMTKIEILLKDQLFTYRFVDGTYLTLELSCKLHKDGLGVNDEGIMHVKFHNGDVTHIIPGTSVTFSENQISLYDPGMIDGVIEEFVTAVRRIDLQSFEDMEDAVAALNEFLGGKIFTCIYYSVGCSPNINEGQSIPATLPVQIIGSVWDNSSFAQASDNNLWRRISHISIPFTIYGDGGEGSYLVPGLHSLLFFEKEVTIIDLSEKVLDRYILE